MNAPHSPSPLASLPMAPSDPILGVTEAYVADKNPKKVNLGVGVYYDDAGKIPLLECVRKAEELRMKNSPHRGYLPIDGLAAYDRAVQELVFGSVRENVVTVQALGGTGGLKLGADFLRRFFPRADAWISEPTWENHRQIFEGAGFTVQAYPYYAPATHGVDFAAMERTLQGLPAGGVARSSHQSSAARMLSWSTSSVSNSRACRGPRRSHRIRSASARSQSRWRVRRMASSPTSRSRSAAYSRIVSSMR